MKKKLLSQSFLRGFIYVLTLGMISIPAPAPLSLARATRKMQLERRGYGGYLAIGASGIAHDFEMFIGDGAKCAKAYNEKNAHK